MVRCHANSNIFLQLYQAPMGIQWALEQFSLPFLAQAQPAPLLLHLMLVSVLQAGLCCLYWMDLHLQSLNGSALVVTHPSLAIGQIYPASLFLESRQTLNRIPQTMGDYFMNFFVISMLYLVLVQKRAGLFLLLVIVISKH